MKNFRQCIRKSKRTGERCKARAMRGKNVCYHHGGMTPTGAASPHFETGRWSKYLPTKLLDKYEKQAEDEDLLSLENDVALIRALTAQHLEALKESEADTHPAWIELNKAHQALGRAMRGNDPLALIQAAVDQIGAIIQPGYKAALAERTIADYLERAGRLADKERKLLIDRQHMLSIRQVNLLLTMLVMATRESVLKHCDPDQARRILTDTQAAYSLAAGNDDPHELPETP